VDVAEAALEQVRFEDRSRSGRMIAMSTTLIG